MKIRKLLLVLLALVFLAGVGSLVNAADNLTITCSQPTASQVFNASNQIYTCTYTITAGASNGTGDYNVSNATLYFDFTGTYTKNITNITALTSNGTITYNFGGDYTIGAVNTSKVADGDYNWYINLTATNNETTAKIEFYTTTARVLELDTVTPKITNFTSNNIGSSCIELRVTVATNTKDGTGQITCQYDTTNVNFVDMTGNFVRSGTLHYKEVCGFSDNTAYNYNATCRDDHYNTNKTANPNSQYAFTTSFGGKTYSIGGSGGYTTDTTEKGTGMTIISDAGDAAKKQVSKLAAMQAQSKILMLVVLIVAFIAVYMLTDTVKKRKR